MSKRSAVNEISDPAIKQAPGDILGHLPIAVYTCNKEGRITYYNETAVKLWGYRPIVGNTLQKHSDAYKLFVNGTFVPTDQTPMAKALATGESFRNIQALIQRPDKSTFYVLINIDPLYDDNAGISGAINSFLDISEIKQTETNIRESEQHYRSLADSLEERYLKMVEEVEDYAIILLDTNGFVLNWNKGAEKIKGYKEAEIIGKSFQVFYLPEDRQSGLPARLLWEAKEKGKALYEGWRKRKDGSNFWGSVVLTALHNDRGDVIGFSKVTRDLTAKKHAEDRMREYMKQLEFRNTELEQFVYAASHDMKEPLRKIHLYNGYISSNSNNVLDEKSKEYFNRSMSAAERMRALIDDLLAYSKITTVDEGHEPVDLNKVIDEITALYKEDFEQKKITVVRDSFPVIKAIPFQVKQLLSNLVDNAAKYKHPEKEGHIAIRYDKIDGQTLQNAAGPFRQFHKITVEDRGIGFDPSFADKIFEIFQRLPGSTPVQGTGIGLAICKKIVQNHHGHIEATGKPGEGAAFLVYLPAL